MPRPWWSTSPNSEQQQQKQQEQHDHDHQRPLITRAKQMILPHFKFLRKSRTSDHNSNRRDRNRLFPSASSPLPQPLPLPNNSSPPAATKVVKERSKAVADIFCLPSPTGARAKERERAKLRAKGKEKEILSTHERSTVDAQRWIDSRRSTDAKGEADSHRSIHPAETWSSRNANQDLKGVNRAHEFNVDIYSRSAPHNASSSSPMVSVDAQSWIDSQRSTDARGEGDSHRSSHPAEAWSPKNAHQDLKGVYRAHVKFSIDISSRSAPPSPSSSPMVSPHSRQRALNRDPFSMCPLDPKPWTEPAAMTSGYLPYSALKQSTTVTPESSPTPRNSHERSPIRPPNTNSKPASPKHPKISNEISHDNNVLMNVHPLPLPPSHGSSAFPVPVPDQVSTSPEILAMKNQWSKGKLIGRGTFGSVYVATNRETGASCAMKEVELFPDDPRSAECMKQLEQEIEVLSHLKHPNIVQYYGSEIVDDRFYIYLEYVYPGSIKKYVSDHCGAITEAVVQNFTRHILSGLAYLHGRNTIHRDIKGANLLVDAFGVVKLADFGMAKLLTGPAVDLSLKGSPYWMAPELMQAVMRKDNSSELAFAVDIWSLGCTVIEMLTGKPPWSTYEGAAAMFKVLKESPPIPETLSPEGKDFLSCCFRRNPADRPTASKLLSHPFLRSSKRVPFFSLSSKF